MTGGVDQVENVLLSLIGVLHLNSVALDGDSSFPFQVHVIQELILFFSFRNRAGEVQQTVGQGTFTMVDMSDDTKVANVLHRSGSEP